MSEAFDWAPFTGTAGDDTVQWSPNKIGDKIVGYLIHVEVVSTKFGPRPLMLLDTDDGTRKVWCSSVGLRASLSEQNPQVGDKVGILFTGEEDTGKGNPMKVFKVKVEKPPKSAPDDPDEDPF